MKRNFKRVNDRRFRKFARINHLSTKNVISLDDKNNLKYLDEFAYQAYLEHLHNESSDFDE